MKHRFTIQMKVTLWFTLLMVLLAVVSLAFLFYVGDQTAQEDTFVNSWVNYTHQNTWAQYPARTAGDSMWSSSAFKTVQFALQFDAAEGRMVY